MDQKTICFFNSHKAWGGGEKWHLEMARTLAQKGRPVLLVSNEGSDLWCRGGKAGLNCVAIKISNLSFLNPIKIWRLCRFFSRRQIETIIVNLPADLKVAGLAAKLAGVRRIIYRRGSPIAIRNTFLNRFLFQRVVTDVIANSEEVKRSIVHNNPNLFPQERIRVIYNGIDLDDFESQTGMDDFKKGEEEVFLGTAGRLSKEKNQKFLLDVACRLKSKGVYFKLLIAGSGELESELKAVVKKMGIEKEVIFLGFVDDMKRFMASIDIFLLPSLWEGGSNALVEAMAARNPVVAFANSSNPEIIENGRTGYLVHKQDVEQFSSRVEALAASAELRKSFGDAGRRRVEKHFSIETTLEQLLSVIGS